MPGASSGTHRAPLRGHHPPWRLPALISGGSPALPGRGAPVPPAGRGPCQRRSRRSPSIRCAGQPVPDALLEMWQADAEGRVVREAGPLRHRRFRALLVLHGASRIDAPPTCCRPATRLVGLAADRCDTLVAVEDEHGLHFEGRLQGHGEPVFLTYPRHRPLDGPLLARRRARRRPLLRRGPDHRDGRRRDGVAGGPRRRGPRAARRGRARSGAAGTPRRHRLAGDRVRGGRQPGDPAGRCSATVWDSQPPRPPGGFTGG